MTRSTSSPPTPENLGQMDKLGRICTSWEWTVGCIYACPEDKVRNDRLSRSCEPILDIYQSLDVLRLQGMASEGHATRTIRAHSKPLVTEYPTPTTSRAQGSENQDVRWAHMTMFPQESTIPHRDDRQRVPYTIVETVHTEDGSPSSNRGLRVVMMEQRGSGRPIDLSEDTTTYNNGRPEPAVLSPTQILEKLKEMEVARHRAQEGWEALRRIRPWKRKGPKSPCSYMGPLSQKRSMMSPPISRLMTPFGRKDVKVA